MIVCLTCWFLAYTSLLQSPQELERNYAEDQGNMWIFQETERCLSCSPSNYIVTTSLNKILNIGCWQIIRFKLFKEREWPKSNYTPFAPFTFVCARMHWMDREFLVCGLPNSSKWRSAFLDIPNRSKLLKTSSVDPLWTTSRRRKSCPRRNLIAGINVSITRKG